MTKTWVIICWQTYIDGSSTQMHKMAHTCTCVIPAHGVCMFTLTYWNSSSKNLPTSLNRDIWSVSQSVADLTHSIANQMAAKGLVYHDIKRKKYEWI